jgi:glycosyltransferase involved in cell wall biosynthesis
MDTEKKLITVVCPVHNEEKVIPLFFDQVSPVISELSDQYRVNLLFINNASTDSSYQSISHLRERHSFVYVISLSKNYGYQCSLECGLRNAEGDIIVFIDVDCEDPPEMILEFVRLYEQGNDIVYGERVDREEIHVIKWMRKLFYHIVRRVADEDIVLYMAEFSLMTSEVRDAVIESHDSFPFIRSSISRVGFKRVGIPYKRHRRIAGETHYNLISMTLFAIAGILSSTTLPLRLPIYIFPFWLILTALLGTAQIMTGSSWFLLINILSACAYIGGTAAFTALYVARTYKNGLGHPNYVIHKRYTHPQTE